MKMQSRCQARDILWAGQYLTMNHGTGGLLRLFSHF